MKTKSILALALTLALMLSLGVCAFADDTKFDATKQYVEGLPAEAPGAACTVQADTVDIGGSTYEVVSVDYEGDLSEYKSHFNVGFTEDSSEILMSMTILKFDAAKLADVLTEVNNINANTTSVKLYLDPQTNAGLGELYLLATQDTVKHISLYASGLFIGFTDKIYEALKDFEA